MTPAGIGPATFRFVAQHLKDSATAVSSHRQLQLQKTKAWTVFIQTKIVFIVEFVEHIQTKFVFIVEFVEHSGLSSVKSSMNLTLLSKQWFQQKCEMAAHKYKLQFDVGGVLKKLKSLSMDEREWEKEDLN